MRKIKLTFILVLSFIFSCKKKKEQILKNDDSK